MKSALTILSVEELALRLKALTGEGKVAILLDDNTCEMCYPLINDECFDLLMVPVGEVAKQLDVAQFLWQSLSELRYTRGDWLVTLGGGSISDLGGFVASTYMRGMHLLHIPTTLLAMIDASIGGKCAIDFGNVKNQIGTFYEPEEVWVALDFLKTLPELELKSGMGELLKYGLLIDEELWRATMELEVLDPNLIARVMQYKLDIVAEDLTDHGIRTRLNLGHTAAHALEALALSKGSLIPHGIAVVAGLVMALYISYKWHGLAEEVVRKLARWAKAEFPKVTIQCKEYDQLWSYALSDKKNKVEGELTMVLLSSIGVPITEQVDRRKWEEALDFYRDYMS